MEDKEKVLPAQEEARGEVFTARWDRTQELLVDRDGNRWKRRLDSIARLIENASTCAAIAIENGSFLIATNKNFPPNSTDQGYLLINTVMTFFKKVAEGTNTEHDFREVFTHICQGAMSGLQLLAHRREELSQDSFIDRVIQSRGGEDFRGLRDYISEQAEEGHYPHDTGAAFVVCSALLKDFDKVIKFIHANKDVADDSPTARFIHAIMVYKTDNIITRDKLEGKVADSEKMHAEMRILAFIEDKLKDKEKKDKYENYIGISKLCCLDCHAIIYAINHAGYNNQIDTRGAHNVQHSGNWSVPFDITGKASRLIAPTIPRDSAKRLTKTNVQPDPFASAIIKQYDEAYRMATVEKDDKITIGAKDVSEHATHSQSSSEDESEHIIISEFSTALKVEKAHLQQLSESFTFLEEEKIFRIIDKLLTDVLMDDSALREWLGSKAERHIIAYLKEFADDAGTVKKILCNHLFVGRTVADRFLAIFQSSDEIKRQKIASIVPDSSLHRVDTSEEQAAIAAKKIIDAYRAGDDGIRWLNAQVFNICTGQLSELNIDLKIFIGTLNLFSSQGNLKPILQSLDLPHRHELIRVLNSQPFVEEDRYNPLREVAKEVQITKLIAALNGPWMDNGGKRLLVVINDLRTGNLQASVKEEFLDVLRIMEPAMHSELRRVLEVISRNPELSAWLLTEIERKFSIPEYREFRDNISHMLGGRPLDLVVLPQPQETLQQRVKRPTPEGGKELDPTETQRRRPDGSK